MSEKCIGCNKFFDKELLLPSVDGDWYCEDCAGDYEYEDELDYGDEDEGCPTIL